jgi:plastocyanin
LDPPAVQPAIEEVVMSARSLVALLALAGLPWKSHAAEVVVEALDGRIFSPATVMIAVGDSVLWNNVSPHPHTVTSGPEGSPDGLFDSGNLGSGESFRYTFTDAGSFDYFCDYHSGMTGQVIVEAVTAPDIVIKLAKVVAEAGVGREWTGGSAPYEVHRGAAKDGSDLALLAAVPSATAHTDAGALAAPPATFYYQVH